MPSQFSQGVAFVSGLIGIVCPVYFGAPACATSATGEKPVATRMDSLLAPVALFPDELLAKILRASTYPLEVNKAAEWVAQNSRLRGQAFDTGLQAQHWDSSINDLARVPIIIVKMNDELVWTATLGDAFLSRPRDVMETIQRLRLKAQNTGFLHSTPQQTVSTRDGMIIITPSGVRSLSVPYYDAAYIYGAFGEQYWKAPPSGHTYQKGVAFLDRVALPVSFATDRISWESGDIFVASGPNSARIKQKLWRHDPVHRHGVAYSSRQLQERFAPGVQLSKADNAREVRSLARLSARGAGFVGIGDGQEIRTFSQRGRHSLQGRRTSREPAT